MDKYDDMRVIIRHGDKATVTLTRDYSRAGVTAKWLKSAPGACRLSQPWYLIGMNEFNHAQIVVRHLGEPQDIICR